MVPYTHRSGYIDFDFNGANNKKGFVTIEHRIREIRRGSVFRLMTPPDAGVFRLCRSDNVDDRVQFLSRALERR